MISPGPPASASAVVVSPWPLARIASTNPENASVTGPPSTTRASSGSSSGSFGLGSESGASSTRRPDASSSSAESSSESASRSASRSSPRSRGAAASSSPASSPASASSPNTPTPPAATTALPRRRVMSRAAPRPTGRVMRVRTLFATIASARASAAPRLTRRVRPLVAAATGAQIVIDASANCVMVVRLRFRCVRRRGRAGKTDVGVAFRGRFRRKRRRRRGEITTEEMSAFS